MIPLRKPRLDRDADGIPILSSVQLEQLAQWFLYRTVPHVLDTPNPLPLSDIVSALTNEGLCSFSFNEDLGRDSNGNKYLGYFDVLKSHICLDQILIKNSGQYRFTLAHELGHFYLHQKINLTALVDGKPEILDTANDIISGAGGRRRTREWIEWQANRFAAALLVPEPTARKSLISIQTQEGVTRRMGTLWLDKQKANRRIYRQSVQRMTKTFSVSKTVIKYRLDELGIVHHQTDGMPTRVGESLGHALADIFRA